MLSSTSWHSNSHSDPNPFISRIPLMESQLCMKSDTRTVSNLMVPFPQEPRVGSRARASQKPAKYSGLGHPCLSPHSTNSMLRSTCEMRYFFERAWILE